MGVLEFLRKLSPTLFENLFKTESNIEKQYNIDIKDSNIVFLLSYDDEVEKHAEELVDNFGGFGRKDLLPIQSEMVTPITLHRSIIKRMELFLDDKDFRALITSATITKLEDKGKNKEANELLRKLTNRHGERGRKIYNMVRSDMFEFLLLPFLEDLQSENRDLFKIRNEFQRFFNDILTYNPIAIWGNESTTEREIVEGLEDRFLRLNMPGVVLIARGEDVIKIIIKNAIETFKKICKKRGIELEIKEEYYSLRKKSACTIYITLKFEVPSPS